MYSIVLNHLIHNLYYFKSTARVCQIFVVFSEYMNFNSADLMGLADFKCLTDLTDLTDLMDSVTRVVSRTSGLIMKDNFYSNILINAHLINKLDHYVLCDK